MGIGEIAVILIITVCILGPKGTEKLAYSLGRGVKALKNAASEVSEPLREVTAPISEAVNEVKECAESVKNDLTIK